MQQNPQLITYSELELHGLAPREADAVTAKKRAEGVAWLKEKIGQAPTGPPAVEVERLPVIAKSPSPLLALGRV